QHRPRGRGACAGGGLMTTRDSDLSNIAFLDLHGVNNGLREEFDLAWKTVLDHGHFVGGPEVERFEREFATYCGAQACVGVANGTDALELILRGLGIGIGDEVILPTNTFIATAEAVCETGARPRFVDVCPDTLLIDPAAALAETIRSMANHGRCAADRYRHDLPGRNSRLDTLQAALLSAKLPGLDAGNARRAAAMAAYRELLPPTCLPVSVQPGAEPVYHLA